jgi:hypothetical protein
VQQLLGASRVGDKSPYSKGFMSSYGNAVYFDRGVNRIATHIIFKMANIFHDCS